MAAETGDSNPSTVAPVGTVVLATDGPSRNQLAKALEQRGLVVVLVDVAEGHVDLGELADHLIDVVDRVAVGNEPVGLLGAGSGTPAVLVAAAARPDAVRAVVARGGRPDEAGPAVVDVLAPTLFLAVEDDPRGLDLEEEARAVMQAHNELRILSTAPHLIHEPDAVDQIADLAGQWFTDWFSSKS